VPIAWHGYKIPIDELDPAQVELCGHIDQQMRKPQLLLVPDTRENGEFKLLSLLNPPVRSLLMIRLLPKSGLIPIGSIILESSQPGVFDSYERVILSALSEFGMIANEVDLGYRETQIQADLRGNLLKTGRGILKLKQASPLEMIANKIQKSLKGELVALYRYDEDTDIIEPPIYNGRLNFPKRAKPIGGVLEPSAIRLILKKRVPYFARIIPGDLIREESNITKDEQFCSVACIPLLVAEKKVGVLLVYYHTMQMFSKKDKETILLFANLAAQAIYNHSLYKAAEDYAKRLNAIHDAGKLIVANIGQEIQATLNLLLKQASENIAKASGVKPTVVTYHRLEQNELILDSVYPKSQREIYCGKIGDRITVDRNLAPDHKIGVTGFAAVSRGSVRVGNVFNYNDYIPVNKTTCSELAVPLKDAERILGVLDLESDKLNAFSLEDEKAVEALADLAVVAIKNADQAEQLQRSSTVAMLGAWAAEILHEIQHPVGLIRWIAFQLLLRQDLPEGVKPELETLDEYASLLDIPPLPEKPPEPGNAILIQDSPIIEHVIKEEIEQFRNTYPKINLVGQLCNTKTPVAIHVMWLKRMLRHLVKNAIKAFPDDQVNCSISIKSQTNGKMVYIFIQDNGPGIPPNIQRYLFRRPILYGANRPGMGLLIVKLLAEQYGGDTWLERNEPGSGATFALSVPIARELESIIEVPLEVNDG
jgi:signal transduction histidine kinase